VTDLPPPAHLGHGPGRPPRPNYALRRAVVASIGLALLALVALGVRALVGGDGSGDQVATAAATSTTDAPTTTTTAPVITEPRRNDLADPPVFPMRQPPLATVSAADPLVVWTLGDSTAQALGKLLESDLAEVPGVDTRTVYKNSTGLTRQDFYDWPAALPAYLAQGAPDVVVLSMGDNDAQALKPLGSGTFVDVGEPGWLEEYQRRLTGFVDQLAAAGARVYLVGQPPMRDPTFAGRIAVVDQAYRNVAAADPEVTYISSKALLGDDRGAYTDTLPGTGGAAVTVRDSDGIHLSLEGARWLARVVGRRVLADYGVQGP
jgi:hypothetical protein